MFRSFVVDVVVVVVVVVVAVVVVVVAVDGNVLAAEITAASVESDGVVLKIEAIGFDQRERERERDDCKKKRTKLLFGVTDEK